MFALILSFFLLLSGQGGNETIVGMREAFFKAKDKDGIELFYRKTLPAADQSALCSAYHGAALAMKAGHASGIMGKFDLFGQGKERIEAAVTKEPSNAEIRFLRYSIQANVPSILLYSSEMDEDFNLILKNLRTQPRLSPFWKQAVKAMIDSEKTSKSQRNILWEQWKK